MRNKQVIIKIVVSLILVVILVNRIDIGKITLGFEKIKFSDLVVLSILFFATIVIRTLKWKYIANDCNFITLLLANITSGFYSVVMPGTIFGDVGRAAYVIKKEKKPYDISVSVVIDQIMGIIALLICGLFGLLLTKKDLPNNFFYLTCFCIIGIIVGLFFSSRQKVCDIVINIINKFPSNKLTNMIKLKGIKIFDIWVNYMSQYRNIVKIILVGLCYQIVSAIYYYLIGKYLNIEISLLDWMWINAITTVVLLLPISLGGIGLREGTLVALFSLIGFSAELAVSVSLMMFLMNVIFAGFGGIVVLADIFMGKEKKGM